MSQAVMFVDFSEYKNIVTWAQNVKDETSPAYNEIHDALLEKYKHVIEERKAQLKKLRENQA